MNWDAVGAIAEAAGAIAVILTLFYLAFQLRQNTRSMDETRKVEIARTVQSRTELRFELFRTILDHPELATAHEQMRDLSWPESKTVYESLSVEEQRAFYNWSRMRLLVLDGIHSQNEMGLISEEVFEGIYPTIRAWGTFWMEYGLLKGFRPSFVAEVKSIVANQ